MDEGRGVGWMWTCSSLGALTVAATAAGRAATAAGERARRGRCLAVGGAAARVALHESDAGAGERFPFHSIDPSLSSIESHSCVDSERSAGHADRSRSSAC